MVRRTLTICGLLCALIIGVATVNAQSGIKGTQKNAKSAQNEADSAQKSVNFAGTWKLDKGKSQFPQQRQADFYKSMTWIVTQDDKQLTRQQQVERNDYEANGGGGGYGGGGRGGMGGGRGGIGGGGGYGGGGGIGGGGIPGIGGGGGMGGGRRGGMGGGGGRSGGTGGGGGGGRAAMGNTTMTVNLDGSETTSDSQSGMTYTAKWINDGKTLEIKTTGNVSATEQWELADGGKTLKVHREGESSQRGTQEWNFVFKKK